MRAGHTPRGSMYGPDPSVVSIPLGCGRGQRQAEDKQLHLHIVCHTVHVHTVHFMGDVYLLLVNTCSAVSMVVVVGPFNPI